MPKTRKTAPSGREAAGKRVLDLTAPNLNRLGPVEPDVHGQESHWPMARRLGRAAAAGAARRDTFQIGRESVPIEQVHAAKKQVIALIVVNPAGSSRCGVALRDARAGVGIPSIGMRLSNIHALAS